MGESNKWWEYYWRRGFGHLWSQWWKGGNWPMCVLLNQDREIRGNKTSQGLKMRTMLFANFLSWLKYFFLFNTSTASDPFRSQNNSLGPILLLSQKSCKSDRSIWGYYRIMFLGYRREGIDFLLEETETGSMAAV